MPRSAVLSDKSLPTRSWFGDPEQLLNYYCIYLCTPSHRQIHRSFLPRCQQTSLSNSSHVISAAGGRRDVTSKAIAQPADFPISHARDGSQEELQVAREDRAPSSPLFAQHKIQTLPTSLRKIGLRIPRWRFLNRPQTIGRIYHDILP